MLFTTVGSYMAFPRLIPLDGLELLRLIRHMPAPTQSDTLFLFTSGAHTLMVILLTPVSPGETKKELKKKCREDEGYMIIG